MCPFITSTTNASRGRSLKIRAAHGAGDRIIRLHDSKPWCVPGEHSAQYQECDTPMPYPTENRRALFT